MEFTGTGKKILLSTHGSRGDVQPFLGLAIALREAGHQVTFQGPKQCEAFVRNQGFPFIRFQGDWEALLKSEKFRELIKSEDLNNLSEIKEWQESFASWADEIATEIQGKDALVINGWLSAHGYLVFKKTEIPTIFVTFQANIPTKKFAFTGLKSDENAFGRDPQINEDLWKNYIKFYQSLHKGIISEYAQKWKINKSDSENGFWDDLMHNLKLPMICAFYEESISGRPDDWPDHVQISGYLEMKTDEYIMPEKIKEFFDNEPENEPVFISFGSITIGSSEVLMNLVKEIVEKTGKKVVLAPGWTKPEELEPLKNKKILIDNDIPYNTLFPKCSVLVHHGGSGTISAALKSGKPQIVVPFLLDQPFWASAMQYIGVGAPPLHYGKFSQEEFIGAIKMALGENYRLRAAEIGERVRKTCGTKKAVEIIEEFLREPKK